MCGITGIFNFNGDLVSSDILRSMTDSIKHRGPDGEGYFTDENVGFGHRRLAVIDLTETGKQPMTTEDESVWITCNGEVYNFKELKKELSKKGHTFKSTSDTEVVLHAYKEWGIDCIKKFNGLFAFALWDKNKKKGYLARDRYGVKPLYYFKNKDHLIFASEIKAILKHPSVKTELDYKAVSEYFTFQNLLSDKTFFKGVKLLDLGTYVEFSQDVFTPTKYWDYDFISNELDADKEELIKTLKEKFENAVVHQMVSDVPVSSYLSGGMDSTSVTTIASRNAENMRSFTCGFDMTGVAGFEEQFDEKEAAKSTAKELGTEHHEMEVSSKDMEEIMPKLIYHLEDFRMSMSFPNYAVSEFVSKHNKVVLSGAGGDELFCGYPWRYNHAVGNKDSEDYLNNYYEYWQRLIKDEEKKNLFTKEAYEKVKDYSTKEVFRKRFENKKIDPKNNKDCINNALQFEAKTFLHGLFVIEDKISMAHSLEVRVPFLDKDFVDFAMKIPLKYKLKNYDELMSIDPEKSKDIRGKYVEASNGKLILREMMAQLIPDVITRRKKQGFAPPGAEWFRHQSQDYVEEILLSERALNRGIFNPDFIKQKIEAHLSGREDHRLFIWSLLCFEYWCRIWMDGKNGN